MSVLNADMVVTPSTTFDLLFYVVELTNIFAEAPSPPPICTRPFNKLVLNFLNIKTEQGTDIDRHGSPSCLLRLVCFEPPSHMYCFC